MEEDSGIIIRLAVPADVKYVYGILEEMEKSARVRGTGISKRTPQSLCRKIYEGKAIIAVQGEAIQGKATQGKALPGEAFRGGDIQGEQEWVGFSYIESWSDGAFVSNSGLIVNPAFRQGGVATAIKQRVFALSRTRYPAARIFSITTGAAVLRMNTKLGFEPVTYAEITRDQHFWDQCRSCVNYPILESRGRGMCLCTAMLFNPAGSGENVIKSQPVRDDFQIEKTYN
jgi:hypothetical protein